MRQRLVLDPAPTPAALLHLRREVGLRLALAPGALVECAVAGHGVPDLRTVEAVARLQLAARRAGGCIRLVDVLPELAALLALAGLPACSGLRVQMIRHPEEWEETGGVQEEGDAADPVA